MSGALELEFQVVVSQRVDPGNLGPLQEQMHLTVEPSLQPLDFLCLFRVSVLSGFSLPAFISCCLRTSTTPFVFPILRLPNIPQLLHC